MPIVLAGLILGALSTANTYVMSGDLLLSAYAGAAATALTWLGCLFLAAESQR
ncbi:hypothetical protein ACIQU5_28100 [Streptomyces sp. NPDC090306]|uniref:hypothetical protein n=1 Tax=Streptomyces sp. NPDC090306 TaxID=3365961 RepID=UPI0038210A2C